MRYAHAIFRLFPLFLIGIAIIGCTTTINQIQTPEVKIQEIETTDGVLVVTKVESSDRIPPGCSPPVGTTLLQGCDIFEGARAVILWISRKDSDKEIDFVKVLGPEIEGGTVQLGTWGNGGTLVLKMSTISEIYITASDGSKGPVSGLGSVVRGRLAEDFLLFALPASARDLTLHWPGNPPIEVGK